jgi:serine/threonine-protein kinase
MGVILRAADDDLGRTLAVKVLLERHQGDAAMVQRFVEEARVCGQLQHPGITPIHELGHLPDGRPFFAMKLVNGHTLDDLLRRRAESTDDLPRFLLVFEHVCQTVAYAHSKGIIHRDLKPLNVMVGAFAEVQVMDWGLAKLVAPDTDCPPGPVSTSTIYSTRASESDWETQAGTVLGTPGYMPPEQARGQVDYLDERADVFGLGAMLCEILTGKPPYVSARDKEVLKQAVDGDLTAARDRLTKCGADRELVDLVLACLAFQPAQRPRDAGAVAHLLGTYRAGVQERLRQAELDRTAAQVKVGEERKRRRLQLGLAAAVLGLLALAAGGGWWLDRQQADRRADHQRRAEQTRQAAEAALGQATELRRQGRWTDARAGLTQAADLLVDQPADDLRRRVEQERADLQSASELDAIRLERANVIQYRFDKSGAERKYVEFFQREGLSPKDEEPQEVAVRVRDSAIRAELVAGLDDWAFVTRDDALRARLLTAARLADPHPWRDQVRDPSAWRDRTALERLAANAPLAEQSPAILSLLGERLQALGADAAPFLLAAQRKYPADFWLNVLTGRVLYGKSEHEESLGYYRAALTVRPDSPAVYRLLGGSLLEMTRLDEARTACEQALRLDVAPDAATHNLLGNILAMDGRLDKAAVAYRRALEIEPKYVYPQSNLGWLLHEKQGRLQEGLTAYRKALDIDPDYAPAHYGLGEILIDLDRLDEAGVELRRAIRLDPNDPWPRYHLGRLLLVQERLPEAAETFGGALRINPRHARSHAQLGWVRVRQGRPEEALGEFYKATLLDPRDAWPLVCLGEFLRERGRLDEAIAAFRKACQVDPWSTDAVGDMASACFAARRGAEAVRFFEEALRKDPGNPIVRTALGNALFYERKLDESIAAYEEALRLLPEHYWPWNALGVSLMIKGESDRAVEALEKSLQLKPRQQQAHLNIGSILEQKGEVGRAEAEFRKALAINPRYAMAHYRLGLIQLGKREQEEGLKSLRRAWELDAANPSRLAQLSHVLNQVGQWDETMTVCRKTIEQNPGEMTAHYYLGMALMHKGQLTEAIRSLRRAVELKPAATVPRMGVAQALMLQGKPEEAVKELREAIRRAPSNGPAHHALGAGLLSQGQFAEAHTELQRSLELLPSASPILPRVRGELAQCEALMALAQKLPAIEAGTATPKDAEETLALAILCQRHLKRYTVSCRFFSEGLSARPELGNDPRTALRYNAACAAAQVIAGGGTDSRTAGDKERAELRRRALGWLRAELAAWAAIVDKGPDKERALAFRMLRDWEKDDDLRGLREPSALANLPGGEREAWLKLWADVKDLKTRAESKSGAARSASSPQR